MAAELITPTDELTGIPLPILLREVQPLYNPEAANRHHLWHRADAPELQTIGGKALRVSRIELVPASEHNVRTEPGVESNYHDYYLGPPLPNDEPTQFDLCVLQCAGYIPSQAIDMSRGEPKIVDIKPQELELMQKIADPRALGERRLRQLARRAGRAYDQHVKPNLSREEYVNKFISDSISFFNAQAGFRFHHFSYGYEPIRNFFRHYALSQDIKHVNEIEIEEFLVTSNEDRKKFLGHKLLAYAIEQATDKVTPIYQNAAKQGSLHPLMPYNARRFVQIRLGNVDAREALAGKLEENLKLRRGVAA